MKSPTLLESPRNSRPNSIYYRSKKIQSEAVHREIQHILKEEFISEKEISYTCKDGIKVVGHCDLVSHHMSTIIEVKTTDSKAPRRFVYHTT